MPSLFIAGHRGMVGSALVREAKQLGDFEILTASRDQLDLCDQSAVYQYLGDHKPDILIMAAAKVGGIHANATYPADFIHDNLVMATNVIEGARRAATTRLLFLGSSCIYPRMAPQPMSEESLLTSELESTNEAYALAKIAGLKLCQYYREQHGLLYHSAMPTNLYGPGDNYHAENSHVIPAMIRRFHEAKENGADTVTIWGTGTPRREFLHVDDLAKACFHLLQLDDPADWINVGTGADITIMELAELVAKTVGFSGDIHTNPDKPDGTPRKLLDITRISATGWQPVIQLESGLAEAYQDFKSSLESNRARL